jgi:signal transduction histidine kinase
MTDHRMLIQFFFLFLGLLGLLPAAASPLHVTQAQWLHQKTEGYSQAPFDLVESPSLGWETVELPHTLPRKLLPTSEQQSGKKPTGVTFYKVLIPQNYPWSDGSRYLYIPRWKMGGQITIYGNQHLLYQSDSLIHWNGWNTPLLIALDKNKPQQELSEITIRIAHPLAPGGGVSSVWLGTHEELSWRYLTRKWLQNEIPYVASSAFLASGIFGLLLWLILRNDKGYLLFFGISVVSFIRTLHYHIGVSRLPVSEEWFTWLTLNSLFWIVWIVNAFMNYLHERPSHRLNQLMTLTVFGTGVLTWPWQSEWINVYQLSPLIYLTLVSVGLLVSVYGMKQSFVANSQGGKMLAAWGVLGMVWGCYDLLLQNNLISIENIYFGPFTNILGFLILMHIIFQGYVAKHEEVNALNANLQLRLQEREAALEQTHRRLREIELQRQLSQERQRIMQDMHDGMGSNLRTALLAVEKGDLSASALADVLKECIDDLKLTIDSMEPMDADLLLLLATFRYRASKRLESAGIALRWNITDIPKVHDLNPQSSLHILRILQEAFTNIIKHSGANEITVTTRALDRHVCVIISDNGLGFVIGTANTDSGRGLNNQRLRAQSIGATIDWKSNTNGTQVTLTLPIDSASKPAKLASTPAG